MRKVTLILTLALLIIALAAGTALAAGPDNIWVDNVKIYGSGAAAETDWPTGVDYDPATYTLTLNGAHITASYKYDNDYAAGIYAYGPSGFDLNIVLKGQNTIEVMGNYDDGIRISKGDLTISGDGSLNIKAGNFGIQVFNGDLIIDGADVTIAQAGISGVFASYDITIKDNSELTITEAGHNGAYAYDNMTITDSIVTITKAAKQGIYTGKLTITDSSSVTITEAGEEGFFPYMDLTITDSVLTITKAGLDGIRAYRSVTITNSEVVITDCGRYGIFGGEYAGAPHSIKIINSYVLAFGERAAIFCRNTRGEGIVLSDCFISEGGEVVKVWMDEHSHELLGWTFSTQGELSSGDNIPIDASQKVVIVPGREIEELAFIILGGVGKNFPFVDVGLNHWAYNDIFDAFKKGLINGVSETLYMPDGPLTYAEAIKLAACIHQLNSMGAVSFETSDPWYQTYVSYAELNQIIQPGEFAGKYNDAINRYDFAHIFGKALPISAFAPINDINSIPDVPSSNRHADEILMLYRAGILVGSDAAGSFYGNSNIKRSEVAAIVVRMIDPEKRIRK